MAEQALWCVEMRGMDEFYPSQSLAAAREHAHALNELIKARGKDDDYEPNVWAVPSLWPWGAEDHAAELSKQP